MISDFEAKSSHTYFIDANILTYCIAPISNYKPDIQERITRLLLWSSGADIYQICTKQRTISEFERDQAFWLKYNSQMYGYMDMTFDKFLKLNSQPKGTDSYQDIVLWLYNYHKKDLQL